MQDLFFVFIGYFIFVIDVIAVLIIAIGVVKSLIYILDNKPTNPGYVIGKALDLGLRYLMVGEVLRSVSSHKPEELYLTGLILLIRIVIVFVNQKEMEHELQLDLEKEELREAQLKVALEEAKNR